MSGETVSMSEAVKPADDVQTRQRSTIAFPYDDLDSAMELATAIHGNAGRGECDDAQLAAWSKQSVKSSGFRLQLSAAKLFGLIVSEGRKHKVTDLGAAIIDPNQARAAKAQAFMNVPLFKAIFDNYKNGVLPAQAAALEREIVGLGVSEKVKDRARQRFEKSAEQAGFFEHGKNRMVMPATVAGLTLPANQTGGENGNGGTGTGSGTGSGGGVELDLDPLLIELLKKIPPAEMGWPSPQRLRWFKTFAMNVSQIYDEDDAPIELEIKTSSATP
ncbi:MULTISPECIES: hypothetical protein [unclassified Mesorhizobium]|uniref:hypothetical protein n=1 Tax=unclassified Mesorhizobium TaxID=325217 RepID=UPI003334D576